MLKKTISIRFDPTTMAYIDEESDRLSISISAFVNQIVSGYMRSTPMIERSIEQAAADLQRQIAETASANHAEVVGLLTAALEALLKLIEQNSGQARQPSTAAQRAALFQPNTN